MQPSIWIIALCCIFAELRALWKFAAVLNVGTVDRLFILGPFFVDQFLLVRIRSLDF